MRPSSNQLLLPHVHFLFSLFMSRNIKTRQTQQNASPTLAFNSNQLNSTHLKPRTSSHEHVRLLRLSPQPLALLAELCGLQAVLSCRCLGRLFGCYRFRLQPRDRRLGQADDDNDHDIDNHKSNDGKAGYGMVWYDMYEARREVQCNVCYVGVDIGVLVFAAWRGGVW